MPGVSVAGGESPDDAGSAHRGFPESAGYLGITVSRAHVDFGDAEVDARLVDLSGRTVIDGPSEASHIS